MKLLVVNADDFGYTLGVNEGIIKAHTEGVVTSTSLMVHGAAVKEAAELAARHPHLDVGLHYQISEEGLVNIIRAFAKLQTTSFDKVRYAFMRQIEEFESIMGKMPTHIDSHHSLHLHAQLRPLFEQFAAEHGIQVRGLMGNRFIKDFFGWDTLRRPKLSKVSVDSLTKLILILEDGVNEIMCHPGIAYDASLELNTRYAAERSAELETLISPKVKGAIEDQGVRLVGWSQVAALMRAKN